MEKKIPIWQKYTLSISEASAYYGIGEKKLRNIVNENLEADFILEIGTHVRIKRILFEEFLNRATTI